MSNSKNSSKTQRKKLPVPPSQARPLEEVARFASIIEQIKRNNQKKGK